ncbi:MAG: UDP-N-acetylglucosamine 2-epimerase (non-hydrolyzing) [Legionella sp.]|nr:UDP-N-acetylglucosamine 2-epimerase (non-hydrolyzing) [Legionella sp.]
MHALIKIMTIIGTRPEIIKLSRVIAELEQHAQHILVHTNQNFDYELNEIFFNDLQISPPHYVLATAGKTAAETIGRSIIDIDQILEKEAPDAVLFYGDTNSCFAAIAAKKRKIPVFHMEAGNRSFDERVPEELNRRLIDHASDINMTLSEQARHNLINEGLRAERIFKIGSPMQEVFTHYWKNISQCDILNKLQLEPDQYMVVSMHRQENVASPDTLLQFIYSLNAIAECHQKTIIVSTHPRTRIQLNELALSTDCPTFHPLIKWMKPFGFFDYIKLQLEAYCILSDSGSIVEDANLLNLPAVILRDMHERPEAMDEAALVMSVVKPANVLNAVALVLAQHRKDERLFAKIADYDVNNVSKKVVRIIFSYIHVINQKTWYKNI